MENRIKMLFLLAALAAAGAARAAEGLVSVPSAYDVPATLERLERIVRAKGMKVFARIDHAVGAAAAGLRLRPTALLIFGHPRGGTPLMQCAQTAGIDLPLKALVWQDAEGKVWLGYNDPAYLAARHGTGTCGAKVVENMSKALAAMAAEATGR